MIFRNFPPPPAFTCLLVLALGLIWTFAPPATIPAVCLGPPQLGKGFWRQGAAERTPGRALGAICVPSYPLPPSGRPSFLAPGAWLTLLHMVFSPPV